MVWYVKVTSTKRRHLTEEKTKVRDNARKLEGIYHFDPKDKECNETLKNMRKKLELCMDSAMPYKVRKITRISSLKTSTTQMRKLTMSTDREKFLAITTTRADVKLKTHACQTHESTRVRTARDSKTKMMSITLQKKGSVHKPVPMHQTMKTPDAKTADDK